MSVCWRSLIAACVLVPCASCGGVPRREGTVAGDCSDEADNDRDGLFDCADPGCAGSPACARDAGPDMPSDGPLDGPPTDQPTDGMVTGDPFCDAGSRQPPERPLPPDDGISVPSVTFAWKEPLVDQREGAVNVGDTIGVNLDRVCTEVSSLATRCAPSGASFEPPLDGLEGIDNAFGTQLVPALRTIDPTLQPASADGFERGLGVVLVELSGWNGQDDDHRVRVVISQGVVGTAPNLDGTCPVLGTDFVVDTADEHRARYPITHPTMAGAYYPLPQWNPANPDCFWSRTDNFVAGDRARPRIVDDEAYVSDRHLVARMGDDVPTWLLTGSAAIAMRLHDALFFGRISADGQRMDPATLAGAWSTVSIYQAAEALGICPSSAFFPILTQVVDQVADVRPDPDAEPVGSLLACDAVSVGITFQGYRGKIAGITEAPPAPDLCP